MRISTVIVVFLMSLSSWAQFQLEARLDTSQITVGEQTQLRFTLHGIGSPAAIVWPGFRDALPSEIELIETSAVQKIPDAIDSYELSILITAWDSGYYAIAPMPITYLDKELETEAMLFTVNNIPVNLEAAPKDIKEIFEEPFNLLDWIRNNWIGLAIVCLIILLILLISRLLKNRKDNSNLLSSPKFNVPPHDRALMRLAELRNRELHISTDKKPFYSELTAILREYLENRYFVPALEQNSSETIESVRYLGLDQQWLDHFRSLLRTADRVKFAKEDASDQISEQHLSISKEFILATIPVAEPESTPSEEDE